MADQLAVLFFSRSIPSSIRVQETLVADGTRVVRTDDPSEALGLLMDEPVALLLLDGGALTPFTERLFRQWREHHPLLEAVGIAGTSQTAMREKSSTIFAATGGRSLRLTEYSGSNDPNQNATTARCKASSGHSHTRSSCMALWPTNRNPAIAAPAPIELTTVETLPCRRIVPAIKTSPRVRHIHAVLMEDSNTICCNDRSRTPDKAPAIRAASNA